MMGVIVTSGPAVVGAEEKPPAPRESGSRRLTSI